MHAARVAEDVAAVAFFLESGRAGSLIESLRARESLRAAGVPSELRREEADAHAKLRIAHAAYQEAIRQPLRAERRSARARLTQAQDAFQAVVTRIQRSAKADAAVLYPVVDELTAMQEHLRDHEVLVLYGLTRIRSFALVVDRKGARVVDLPSPAKIHALCNRLLLPRRPYIAEEHTAAAQDFLIRPLALEAHHTRVFVSPMGPLGHVPFGLLMPAKEIAYVPSGTTLGILLKEQDKRGTSILALGDPDYDPTGDDVARDAQRSPNAGPLTPLPGSRKEVQAIGDVTLLGERATEAGLRAALDSHARWRAVHFACHGLLDADRPMLSSLALTATTEDDGFLSCLEIFRMTIPADLVVLSACETAKGTAYKTEGIVGMTRAFMFAGAPRVIASLWKVDDDATHALMIKFYELWDGDASDPGKANGRFGAASALKQAQAYVRGHEKWKHPYYWAAWVLWGLP